MAIKTKKQQQKLIDLVKLILLITALGSYYLTKDIFVTGIIIILMIITLVAFTLFRKTKEKERLRKSGIKDIDTMNGIQFEYYLKELYRSQGYKVEVTKAKGDFGADLILFKDKIKIVVQAKRYSGNVGVKAVQEILAAKSYYSASAAWVVSNSDYTNAAIELAKASNVLLINREKLIKSILKMNPNALPTAKEVKKRFPSEIICDRCGGKMILRKGKNGSFLGCSNFPKCRNTKDKPVG